MTDLPAAVHTLTTPQTLRIHYLPTHHYTAHAPCPLQQLRDAVALGTEHTNRTTATTSRPPIAVDALDLWTEILTAVHTWARHLGIQRTPYREGPTRPAHPDRQPDWMRRLHPYIAPVDWTTAPHPPAPGTVQATAAPPTTRPALYVVPVNDPTATFTVPPVGLLLRAAAAEAIATGQQPVADTMTRKATAWADRIATMLGALGRAVHEIRGMACADCGDTTVLEDRPGDGVYRVPAIEVRLLPRDEDQSDDLWPYRSCRACGSTGWVAYSTSTPPRVPAA